MRFVLLILGLSVAMAHRASAAEIDRPLRYTPDNGDFVIENGPEFFNRPLYGSNTAFRVDAGDKPEFSLFLPGRGGNLRLGIRSASTTKWLNDAQRIVTRYHAGTMLYEINDTSTALRLTAAALGDDEGLILKIEATKLAEPTDLIVAFGGVNGDRGSRNGDIGAEREPVATFFALKPDYCRGNEFTITGDQFVVQAKPGRIRGLMPRGATLGVADAANWSSAQKMLTAAGNAGQSPLLLAHVPIKAGESTYLALQRLTDQTKSISQDDLPTLFEQSQRHIEEISQKVVVDTPDPFINAAVPALCVAADGVWDAPGKGFMHGAVAWRNKLLGWRGAYAGDALGWHDRTRQHLSNFTERQNTSPIPASQPAADPDSNLARSERALHSNGDLTNSHYDMNLVAIDAMFRHLLWTGDIDYARKMWPVIQRHLAWERRLFRREFDGLPLYEAYCCIWASDDLQYSGGGVTHASAYNYWHNRMAARVAEWIGEDPKPYRTESELILKGMKQHLWLNDRGWFAEYKDLLGEKRVHPAAALWTYYHTTDSQLPDAFEAYQMGRYVDTQIAHIPIRGRGVPNDRNYFILPTTNWMPYMWSTNNVVLAETMHASLADWQAQRPEQAFDAFKGSVLDSMFVSLCPGNLHMASYFDAYRHESQRDFADPIGITSRALVEGLFGVVPDAIDGELLVRPGFPAEWDHASMRHPDFTFAFARKDNSETYQIDAKFNRPMRLRLRIAAMKDRVASLTVNGKPAEWKWMNDAIDRPLIELQAEPAQRWEVNVSYQGDFVLLSPAPQVVAVGDVFRQTFDSAELIDVADPEGVFEKLQTQPDSFTATIRAASGHHTCFARLREGRMTRWTPIRLEVRPPYEIVELPSPADRFRFNVRNNTSRPLEARRIDTFLARGSSSASAAFSIPPRTDWGEETMAADGMMPGGNRLVVEFGQGRRIEKILTNWHIIAPADTKWDPIDLAGSLNDRVTQIFRNQYLSPRSPYCSLSMPIQGLGGWCTIKMTADIDDSGLWQKSKANGGMFVLPQGVPFKTPGDAESKNIAFVSQWDNYPRQIQVPLTGKASHAYFLMAGSTNPMQSRIDNGEVVIHYTDGSADRLALENPTTWWPIERDYYIDDYAFARPGPVPPRVDLKTGAVLTLEAGQFREPNATISGGAATVLDLPLDPTKELKSLTVRATANEVVIGVMGVTLAR